MPTRFYRPTELLAGFGSEDPEPNVPELSELGEQWAPDRFKIEWHKNQGWELFLQIEGESQWETDQGVFSVTPGGYYILGPEVRHRLLRFKGIKQHYFFAVIAIPAVARYAKFTSPVWANALNRQGTDGLVLRAGFEALIHESVHPQAHRVAALRMYLGALVITATRLLENAPRGERLVSLHPAVARAHSLLESSPERNWSLPTLARLVGLSPNYLSEVFHKEYGVPPHRYLLEQRLRRAAELLSSTELSITDLALETGFNSGQHLARYFRKHYGCSAQEYRKGKGSNQDTNE